MPTSVLSAILSSGARRTCLAQKTSERNRSRRSRICFTGWDSISGWISMSRETRSLGRADEIWTKFLVSSFGFRVADSKLETRNEKLFYETFKGTSKIRPDHGASYVDA